MQKSPKWISGRAKVERSPCVARTSDRLSHPYRARQHLPHPVQGGWAVTSLNAGGVLKSCRRGVCQVRPTVRGRHPRMCRCEGAQRPVGAHGVRPLLTPSDRSLCRLARRPGPRRAHAGDGFAAGACPERSEGASRHDTPGVLAVLPSPNTPMPPKSLQALRPKIARSRISATSAWTHAGAEPCLADVRQGSSGQNIPPKSGHGPHDNRDSLCLS